MIEFGTRPRPVDARDWRHAPRCPHWMPYAREQCGRRAGHGGTHRTGEALDNANVALMGHPRRSPR